MIALDICSPIPGSWMAKLLGGIMEALGYIFAFYSIGVFIFPQYWKSRRIFILVAFILMSYCIFTAITYVNYFILVPYLKGIVFYETEPISILFLDDALYFSIYGSAGAAFFFYRLSKAKYLLQAEKEKSILQKELRFLKNQFNSHITFNFLNYCYSNIHKDLPDTAEAIDVFSEMLRYNLKSTYDDKVPLSNEIILIDNMIKLKKKIDKNVNIKFIVNGRTENILILPNIISNMAEMALNQGSYNQCSFTINLDTNNYNLTFSIHSKILTMEQKIDHAFNNLKKILDLYYANNFTLKRNQTNDHFYTELKIFNWSN